MQKRLIVVFCAALILEAASTAYVSTVADHHPTMVALAALGPWLNLPFYGYMVTSGTTKERIRITLAQSLGYALGSFSIYLFL